MVDNKEGNEVKKIIQLVSNNSLRLEKNMKLSKKFKSVMFARIVVSVCIIVKYILITCKLLYRNVPLSKRSH